MSMQISFLKSKRGGFTLLELSISLLILTILVGFSMPRMTSLFQSPLEKEAIQLASILSELKNQAILKRESYKIIFNLPDENYSIVTQDVDDLEKYNPHIKYKEPIQLKPPVVFQNISENNPDDTQSKFGFEKITFDKIFGQKFTIKIDSAGLIDLFKVHLKTREKSISVTVKNVMGEIEISNENSI